MIKINVNILKSKVFIQFLCFSSAVQTFPACCCLNSNTSVYLCWIVSSPSSVHGTEQVRRSILCQWNDHWFTQNAAEEKIRLLIISITATSAALQEHFHWPPQLAIMMATLTHCHQALSKVLYVFKHLMFTTPSEVGTTVILIL